MATGGEAFSWTAKLTIDFLEIYAENQEKFANINFKNAVLWEEISRKLRTTDGERMSWPTAQQCSNRWKSLKSSSQKFLDSQKETGVSRKREPPFHQRVMDLIGDKCSVEPAAVMDSGSALPSLYGPTASCASAPASPGVSDFDFDHTTGGMTSALPVAVRGATSVASSVTAKSPLPQTCDKPAAAVMEGAASERGKLRKHERHRRRKRESAADGFSKFVKAHEEREKRRSKETKKRHKEKMKVMKGLLQVMKGFGGGRRERRFHERKGESSSSSSSPSSRSPSPNLDSSSGDDDPTDLAEVVDLAAY